MNLSEITKKIIPENLRELREGFDNYKYIVKLTETEKQIVVNDIKLIISKSDYLDLLLIRTLGYIGTKDAFQLLMEVNSHQITSYERLVVNVSLYLCSGDEQFENEVIKIFNTLQDHIYIIHSFFYLSMIKSDKIRNIFKRMVRHENILISRNAKKYL